jgi:hypothetical protein
VKNVFVKVVIKHSVSEDIQQIGVSKNVDKLAQKMLWKYWNNSLFRKTAYVNDEIAAIWGCSGSFVGLIGAVWLVTNSQITLVPFDEFRRIARAEIREMLKVYTVLENPAKKRYIGVLGVNQSEPLIKIKRFFL